MPQCSGTSPSHSTPESFIGASGFSPLFTGSDVTNPLQQLIEIVWQSRCHGLAQAFIIHGEALDQVLAQTLIRPLTKLRASLATHAKPNGQNDGQAVMGQCALDLPSSFGSNL